jgi:hypothetical protein
LALVAAAEGGEAMTPRKVSRETRRQAIRILGEAARTDGRILPAARRLGMSQSLARGLALHAYFESAFADAGITSEVENVAVAESLLRQGWEP